VTCPTSSVEQEDGDQSASESCFGELEGDGLMRARAAQRPEPETGRAGLPSL